MNDKLLNDHRIELDLPGATANIRRQGSPKRVYGFEHGFEPGIKAAICARFGLDEGLDKAGPTYRLEREIRLYQFLGIEFMRVIPGGIVWPGLPAAMNKTPPAVGPIGSWHDFETYPWPSIRDVNWADVEWYERHLPDNLALWSMTYLFQMVSNLFGFEPLCLLLHEERELVKAVTERVGQFYLGFAKTLCQFGRVGAINIGDDMGHKSGTLIAPADLREIFMPWQRRIIAAAQTRGKLGLFHCCGRVETIMDDLINTVRIDAKHSTQDATEPIQQTWRHWGGRVTLLGGVDIDLVTRARSGEIERYTRAILETCATAGGFALGLGNWVADSIPLDNYLAVLAAARTFRSTRNNK
jgi:uroporphyrinogen decarboxylase